MPRELVLLALSSLSLSICQHPLLSFHVAPQNSNHTRSKFEALALLQVDKMESQASQFREKLAMAEVSLSEALRALNMKVPVS